MKIAVDARPLSIQMTGIGRYTHSLLNAMTSFGQEWILYSDAHFETALSERDNVTIRCGDSTPGSVSGLVYSQGVFRSWLKNDSADLYWSPRHHLPLWLNRDTPQVLTIHDVVWKRHPETMQISTKCLENLLMAPSIRQADKIICVSEFTRTEVAEFWPRQAGKCVAIRSGGLNPENVREFGQQNEYNADSVPYILFVGTREPRKNLAGLLKAFAELTKQYASGLDLVIVGAKGWGSSDLDSHFTTSSMRARVRFEGYIEDLALQRLYVNAECLVMPSFYEGFGLPVLEAMQVGTPVVVSQGGALEEIAGHAGVLVDPYSTKSIVNGISSILNDKDFRKKLSQKAFIRAEDFSWEKAAKETLAVFQSQVTKSQSG
jgi:glycosyltransferase involved in cell wall biosynthesis